MPPRSRWVFDELKLNGKKPDVDNCATNATSRFKDFWACPPVCLSVAAITHHKTETDVQLLPAVRCPAPSTTKTGALCCSRHFDITLCRSSCILKLFKFVAWISLFNEMRFHIIHLGLRCEYTNGCANRGYRRALWTLTVGTLRAVCVLLVHTEQGMATYYFAGNQPARCWQVLCFLPSVYSDHSDSPNSPLVWACHHNADRITHHHVTLHPANNNGSVPPTTAAPNFHATQTSRQNWTKVLNDTKQIHTRRCLPSISLQWVSDWMSEWVSEWVIEWISEWVSDWVSLWVIECVSEWVSEWMSEWVSDWVNKWVSESMSDWVSEWVSERVIDWVNKRVSEWLSESVSDWVRKRVSQWVSQWISEWVIEWISEWVSEWVIEWMSEWVIEWMSEWVIEWVSELVSEWLSEWC